LLPLHPVRRNPARAIVRVLRCALFAQSIQIDGAKLVLCVAAKARRQGIRLFITGAWPSVRRALLTHGVSPPRARYRETIARALADIRANAGSSAGMDEQANPHADI
jgi:hypothetical protein